MKKLCSSLGLRKPSTKPKLISELTSYYHTPPENGQPKSEDFTTTTTAVKAVTIHSLRGQDRNKLVTVDTDPGNGRILIKDKDPQTTTTTLMDNNNTDSDVSFDENFILDIQDDSSGSDFGMDD